MRKESKLNENADEIRRITTGVAMALVLSSMLLAATGAHLTLAQQSKKTQSEAAVKGRNEAKLIARGKYIVEGLAACGDCHTPRSRDGDIDRTKWLSGAPVFYEPAQSVPGWAITAPRIAGVPPGRDAEIITLLTTATWRDGKSPRPPMPRFQMKREDAEAVVAYLKSL